MNLEFELETAKISRVGIIYDIKRKGLKVGEMYLDKPYNEPKINKKMMTMHNELLR